MKKFGFRAASILVALLLAVCGFAGCKKKPVSEPPPDGSSSGGQTKPPTEDGGFEFLPGEEEQKSAVVFMLSNATDPTVYLRLTDVYVFISGTNAAKGESVQIRLDRSPEPNGTTMSYWFGLGDESVGKWIAPFDLSITDPSNLVVASFRYYRLTVETYNVRIDEVVFVGEELTSNGGVGTGQYRVIPVQIYSATPAEGETGEEALQRAGALVDRQNSSYEQIKKLKESEEKDSEE